MRMVKKPNFLVVQYAPGAGGKFLSSLLMSSDSVAHYDPDIQADKTVDSCVRYIRDHFSNNFNTWIGKEPNHGSAWNLHFISSKFSRGDELTVNDLCVLAEKDATDHFCKSVNNGLIIPTVTHKHYESNIFRHSNFVTIINDKQSEKWYNRALWNKMYGFKDGKIYLKANDPTLNPAMSKYFEQFKTPMFSDDSFFNFVKREVISNPYKLKFLDKNNFTYSPNRLFIMLSDLLNIDTCATSVNKVCTELGLNPISKELIIKGHSHWLACHNFKWH